MAFAPWIGLLAVIGIVYGALVSLVQPDLKKLVAYSSVSHLGFVMLGIAAFSTASLTGAVYQMLNHGISTGALFFMVGMLYERRHTRLISEFGGLRRVMPWFFAMFLLVTLSSIAVPGFNGFVGEFLILVGSWKLGAGFVVVASLGVVLAAAYMLWMVQRVFYGEVTNPKNDGLPDLSAARVGGGGAPRRPRPLHGGGQPALHALHRAERGPPGDPAPAADEGRAPGPSVTAEAARPAATTGALPRIAPAEGSRP